MDVLFINPPSRSVYQSLGGELAAIEPPIWALMLASHAAEVCHLRVGVIDAEAEQLNSTQVAEQVEAVNPLLVVVVVYGHQPSASTQVMPGARECCRALKRMSPTRPVLMVGGHVAALPERTMREECCDYACTGEGVVTVGDLVAALASGSGVADVRGLAYRTPDNAVRFTPPAPLMTDLDSTVPRMRWDLLPRLDKYRAHNWHTMGRGNRSPYAALYTTLGCSLACHFCCIQAPFRSGEKELGYKDTHNSYRRWSPQHVVSELARLADMGVRHVKLADEMFVLNRWHVEAICDLLFERGLDLNIWAYARVDTVQWPTLQKLKRAGVNWLALGIESGNADVRKASNKAFTQQAIFNARRMIQDAGINLIGNFIFGLPHDTLDSMRETLDLAVELNCEFANFYCAVAYPGSELFRQAAPTDLPDSWSGYSQHAIDAKPLPTEHLTSKQVLKFRDAAFQEYFLGPRYLEMIERKFGEDAATGIVDMASITLERLHV